MINTHMLFENIEEDKEKELPNKPEETDDSEDDFKPADISDLEIAEREDALKKIEALEKKSGLNLDKTEEEVRGEIDDAMFSGKPKAKSERKNAEGVSNKLKNELIKHVGSIEYFNKLKIEFGGDEIKAKRMQKERVANLKDVKITVMSLDDLNKEYIKRLDGKKMPGGLKKIGGFYDSGAKELIIPQDKSPEVIETIVWHELGHASTEGDKGVTSSAEEMLEHSYKKQGFLGMIKNKADEYFMDPTERLTRKQNVDRELEKLGIKKYGEEFTDEHYAKMMKYYKEGKFSWDANDFIKRTDPKMFKKIFNEIAANEEEAQEKAA
jgi:hypothetical protein